MAEGMHRGSDNNNNCKNYSNIEFVNYIIHILWICIIMNYIAWGLTAICNIP